MYPYSICYLNAFMHYACLFCMLFFLSVCQFVSRFICLLVCLPTQLLLSKDFLWIDCCCFHLLVSFVFLSIPVYVCIFVASLSVCLTNAVLCTVCPCFLTPEHNLVFGNWICGRTWSVSLQAIHTSGFWKKSDAMWHLKKRTFIVELLIG